MLPYENSQCVSALKKKTAFRDSHNVDVWGKMQARENGSSPSATSVLLFCGPSFIHFPDLIVAHSWITLMTYLEMIFLRQCRRLSTSINYFIVLWILLCMERIGKVGDGLLSSFVQSRWCNAWNSSFFFESFKTFRDQTLLAVEKFHLGRSLKFFVSWKLKFYGCDISISQRYIFKK